MNLSMISEPVVSIADRFRGQYGSSPDWYHVARDHNIIYREDNRIVVPMAAKTESGQPVVGVKKNAGTPSGEWSRAHEFGHILLNHVGSPFPEKEIKEIEADYFAGRVLGKRIPLEYFVYDVFNSFLKHPLSSLITIFANESQYNKYLSRVFQL